MNVLQSQSTVRPLEWDTESSPTTVYHNTEIETQPATADTPQMYNYRQEAYTMQEYAQLMTQDAAQRLDLAEAAILAIMDGGMTDV